MPFPSPDTRSRLAATLHELRVCGGPPGRYPEAIAWLTQPWPTGEGEHREQLQLGQREVERAQRLLDNDRRRGDAVGRPAPDALCNHVLRDVQS